MIRDRKIKKPIKGKSSFPLIVVVFAASLAGCTTAQKEASLQDENQEVVALLPSPEDGVETASTPKDPYVVATAKRQDGQMLESGTSMVTTQRTFNNNDADALTGEQGSALGIMQATRVKASAGSIFSNVAIDPTLNAQTSRSIKPVRTSLFSAVPVIDDDQPIIAPETGVIVPDDSVASVEPANISDYDAGIVVLNRQTDEQRRVMAEKNDLTKNANPQARAMEPEFNAAPANDPASLLKPVKKRWSLKDLFGDLGKTAGKGKNTAIK